MKILLTRIMDTGAAGAGRRGSTSVMALMVTMFLMSLVTATMALTLADVEKVQDYARNRKAYQATMSGIEHGRAVMAGATATFNLPKATRPKEVKKLADLAEAKSRTANQDISLLTLSGSEEQGGQIGDILARRAVKTAIVTEDWSDGMDVGYQVSYDIWPTSVERPASGDITEKHIFHYDYSVTSAGLVDRGGQHSRATRVESGSLDTEVSRPSFATYGYFTDSMKNQFDDQLVFWGGETYDGPVHVNSEPPEGRAGFWGSPVFTGPFTAVQDSYADSWLGGNAEPQFNGGATWNVDRIDLPANSFSQLRAAIGDTKHIDDQLVPSNSALRSQLGLPSGSDPVDTGVYVSKSYNTGNTLNGGIFVNGNPNWMRLWEDDYDQVIEVNMTASTGQWAGTHTFTIRDDIYNNRCRYYVDGVLQKYFTGTINGVIHTQGEIKELRGKTWGDGEDIDRRHELTVSATGDITIRDSLTYEMDPRYYPDWENILGIFSSGGNIMLHQDAPSDIQIHATLLAASEDHGLGAKGLAVNGGYNYSYPYKGQLNLFGGLIEDKNQTTGVFYSNGHKTGYEWNLDYDERFAEGKAPPYFPYVTKFIMKVLVNEAENWGRKYY